MAAVTVAARGDAGYVDPNQQVVSLGWSGGTHTTKVIPRNRLGRTVFITVATDGDTLSVSNWRGPVPNCGFLPDTEDTTATPYPTISGTTLTITMQADAATTGWLDISPAGVPQG
jgi:hypothetical protein